MSCIVHTLSQLEAGGCYVDVGGGGVEGFSISVYGGGGSE